MIQNFEIMFQFIGIITLGIIITVYVLSYKK